MNFFISLGMNGKSDEDVLVRMDYIRECINEAWGFLANKNEVNIIDTFIKEEPPKEAERMAQKRVWYLGDSIKLMHKADVIIFDTNFAEYSGCKIEYMISKEYGFVSYWISPIGSIVPINEFEEWAQKTRGV